MAHWITDANGKRIKVAGNYPSSSQKPIIIYDKSGATISENWGYPDGILFNSIFDYDFSGFKKVEVFAMLNRVQVNFVIDLEHKCMLDMITNYGYMSSGASLDESQTCFYTCLVGISNNKDKINFYKSGYINAGNFTDRSGGTYSTYYVAQVRGYK